MGSRVAHDETAGTRSASFPTRAGETRVQYNPGQDTDTVAVRQKNSRCIAQGGGAMMPGRARRERAMKRVSSALRMVLTAGVCGSSWASRPAAATRDPAHFAGKVKNLRLTTLCAPTMGGRMR